MRLGDFNVIREVSYFNIIREVDYFNIIREGRAKHSDFRVIREDAEDSRPNASPLRFKGNWDD